MMPLPDKEYKRQLRQIETEGWGPEAQQRLKNSRVLIVGLGAVGLAAVQLLSASGIGFLALADQSLLKEEDLSSQCLLQMQDLGKPKAKAACSRLWAAHPFSRHFPLCYQIQPKNLPKLLENISMVLDASGSEATHRLVGDACLMAGIPWILAESRASSFSVAWCPGVEDPLNRYPYEAFRDQFQAPLHGTGLWTAAGVMAGLEAAALLLDCAGSGTAPGALHRYRDLRSGTLRTDPLQGPAFDPDTQRQRGLLSAEQYGLEPVAPLED